MRPVNADQARCPGVLGRAECSRCRRTIETRNQYQSWTMPPEKKDDDAVCRCLLAEKECVC